MRSKNKMKSKLIGRLAELSRPGLRGSRSGVAALEFAILAPLMISTVGGMYDLTTAFLAWKRVGLAAQSIAEMATSMAATSADTNQLDEPTANLASSAVYAYLPNILTAAPRPFGVAISSVAMVPRVPGCTSGCIYTPHTAWSGVFQGAATRRPCDTVPGIASMSYVADTASPSPTTLPADIQSSPAPVLIVDVSYTFKPLFFTYITGTIQMMQSAYLSPRTGLASDWVHYYQGNSDGHDSTVLCTGYPASMTVPS